MKPMVNSPANGIAPDTIDMLSAADVERRITTKLLEAIGRQSDISQRKLASEFGVALGLVNLYIKRCVTKGLIKVEQVPSRRYAYYLTAKGFAEKSRLTAEYLSWSLNFFRRARSDCSDVISQARAADWRSVGLLGGGDLAEVAILCASEQNVGVAAVVDAAVTKTSVLGIPVVAHAADVSRPPDGWIVTAVENTQAVYDAAQQQFGAARVLAPAMLSLKQPSEMRQ